MNIHDEAQYSNFLNAEFVFVSINISPLSGAGTSFAQGGGKKYEIQYKFCFAPKLPSNCINQNVSMVVGSLHIL